MESIKALAFITIAAVVCSCGGGKEDKPDGPITPSVVAVSSVSLSKTEAELVVGNTLQLTATVSPSNATDKTLTWNSSSSTIASVSPTGLVTAKAEGSANITASCGGKSATCKLTVKKPIVAVTSVELDKPEITLDAEETYTLKATVKPDNATDKTVTWASSKPDIATVDNNGKVTGVNNGVASVTATSGGKSASCKVNVVVKVKSITLSQTTATISVGEDPLILTATISPDNAADKTVTWSTNNASVATVSNGKVTAVTAGTATITAKAGDKSATCTVTVIPEAVTPLTFWAWKTNKAKVYVSLKKTGSPRAISIECKIDNGKWEEYTIGKEITLTPGQKVAFRAGANGNVSVSQSMVDFYRFNIRDDPYTYTTNHIDASGNIMSLLNRSGSFTIQSPYCFYSLFSNNEILNSVSELELPATTLAEYCYSFLFSNCLNLQNSPKLPATKLATFCYGYMFYNTNLGFPPQLPATELKPQCYEAMFAKSWIYRAPALPATTLASECYKGMFNECSKLTSAPALPATTLAEDCYAYMFGGSGLIYPPKLPATKLAMYCYSGMFSECAKLESAPELPATTLAFGCYERMFYKCEKLTSAPVLWARNLVGDCYKEMFRGCVKLNYVKARFTTKPGSSYTSNWLSGVSATGTFVKNSSATWNVSGSDGIPSGWTVRTE